MPIITASGNIGKYDLRYTQNGTPILNVSIAENNYNSKTKETETIWINALWVGKIAESIAQTMGKVQSISITGKEQYKIFNDKIQREIYVLDFNFLGWKSKNKQGDETSEVIDISDSDLPF